MATEQEVRDGALRMLGVIDIGEDASVVDPTGNTYMTQKYNEIYAMLKIKGNAYWASGSAIPDQFSPHVQALMAFFSLLDYSVSQERRIEIEKNAAIATREIPNLGIPDYESTDIPKNY